MTPTRTRLAIMAVTVGALSVSAAQAHAHARQSTDAKPSNMAAGLSCSDNASQSDWTDRFDSGEPVGLSVVLEVAALPERDNDEGSVPWCSSADDPRCSPMPGGSLPPDVASQPRLSLNATTLDAQPPVGAEVTSSVLDSLGAPRAGEHASLDRPPRG